MLLTRERFGLSFVRVYASQFIPGCKRCALRAGKCEDCLVTPQDAYPLINMTHGGTISKSGAEPSVIAGSARIHRLNIHPRNVGHSRIQMKNGIS